MNFQKNFSTQAKSKRHNVPFGNITNQRNNEHNLSFSSKCQTQKSYKEKENTDVSPIKAEAESNILKLLQEVEVKTKKINDLQTRISDLELENVFLQDKSRDMEKWL